MDNPFMQAFGPRRQPNIVEQFNAFRQSFRGDPQQAVMQMLQSGRISQSQFEEAKRQATQFQQMLGNFR